MSSSPKWVTIATYNWVHDGYIPRALLESEGIQCQLRDENMAQLYSLAGGALGGCRLQCLSEDVSKAKTILDRLEQEPEENLAIQEDAQEELGTGEIEFETEVSADTESDLRCIKCNSDEVVAEKTGKLLAVIGMLFGSILLPLSKNRYYCFDCGHRWKKSSPEFRGD